MSPTETTEMLVVRHGQSTWNEMGRWQGREADPPLSSLGELQASTAAKSIGRVDVIVTSPLKRALGTAAIIAEHIGVGPVEVLTDLEERAIGAWSGLTRRQIEARWPGWIDTDRRPPGWEYDAELLPRAIRAFETITTEWTGATILVVAHGGVIVAMERHLKVNKARIPNLHGRIIHRHGVEFRAGDPISLVPEEMRTGGRSGRL